jgi:outer membrane protein
MRRALTLTLALTVAVGAAARPARAQADSGGGSGGLPAELSLDAALRIGRTHQPQLRQAQALTAAADARVDEARAPLLPQLSATAGYLRRTVNPVAQSGVNGFGGANPANWNTANFFSSGLSLSQLVWDFGQAWERRKAARATADAQEETERTTALTTDLAIRTTFFTARTARDAVTVAKEALANQNTHVDQIKAFTEIGTHPEIDLLQAQSDQANAEVSLINAQNDYATARVVLNQAMGVEAPASYEVVGEPTTPIDGEAGALEPLVDEAVRARPDVTAIVDQVRAQELTNRATADRYFPAVSASTGLTYAGQDLGQLTWNWSAGLTLAWPIIEGGLVRATQREGDASLAALRTQVDILRQQIRVDVDAARLAIAAAKAALVASERGLANARGRLDLAEVRYKTGVGTGIELSDAQLAATNAAFLKLQTTLKLDTARAQLQKALGRR